MKKLFNTFELERDILRCWFWVVPVLLVMAFLSMRQLDMYPPTVDEFYSMNNAGWFGSVSYSPIDVIESLAEFSPNHTPGYFLLLNLWGRLVGHDVVLGRTLSILMALLSLAMIYRLARDFVAPAAGLFALVIVSCNAFYNYYYILTRMYPLLVFVSALVMWLYLRMVYRRGINSPTDYFALGASAYALANTHIFSALFFAMLGAYHLLMLPKNRLWVKVTLTLMLACLMFSPWLAVIFTSGIERTFHFWQTGTAEFHELVRTWYEVTFNGTWLLPLLAVAGVAIGVRRKLIQIKPYHFLYVFFYFVFWLTVLLTDAIQFSSMRLVLSGLPPLLLFVTAGFFALYRLRRWLGVLILLWAVAGVALYRTGTWDVYLGGRAYPLRLPPWQGVSRLAQDADITGVLLGFGFDKSHLYWLTYIDYSQHYHYFEQHGLTVQVYLEVEMFRKNLSVIAATQAETWVFYQTRDVRPDEAEQLGRIMREHGYQACAATKLGRYTILTRYLWQSLDCQSERQLPANGGT